MAYKYTWSAGEQDRLVDEITYHPRQKILAIRPRDEEALTRRLEQLKQPFIRDSEHDRGYKETRLVFFDTHPKDVLPLFLDQELISSELFNKAQNDLIRSGRRGGGDGPQRTP